MDGSIGRADLSRFKAGERLLYRDHDSMTTRVCTVVVPPGRVPAPDTALVAFAPTKLNPGGSPTFLHRAAANNFQLRVPIHYLHRPSPEVDRLAELEQIWHNRITGPKPGAKPMSKREELALEVEMTVLDALLEDHHPYISRSSRAHGLRRLAETPLTSTIRTGGPITYSARSTAAREARRLLGRPLD